MTHFPCTKAVTRLPAFFVIINPPYHRKGIEIWEFDDKKRFHTNSFVIDNIHSVIWSYNLYKVAKRNNVKLSRWVKSAEIAPKNSLWMEN